MLARHRARLFADMPRKGFTFCKRLPVCEGDRNSGRGRNLQPVGSCGETDIAHSYLTEDTSVRQMPTALARSLAEEGDRPRRVSSRTPWRVDKGSTSPARRRRPGHRNHFQCLAQSHTPREMRLPFCPPARLGLCLRLVCADCRSVGHPQPPTHPSLCTPTRTPSALQSTHSVGRSVAQLLYIIPAAAAPARRMRCRPAASYYIPRLRVTPRPTAHTPLATDGPLNVHSPTTDRPTVRAPLPAHAFPAVPPLLQLSDTRFASSS